MTAHTRILWTGAIAAAVALGAARGDDSLTTSDAAVWQNATVLIARGRSTFRFDTFGDEAFWGGALRLHEAIAGAANGGVGAGLSPKAALGARAQGRRRARCPRTLSQRSAAGQGRSSTIRPTTLALLQAQRGRRRDADSSTDRARCAPSASSARSATRTVDDSFAPGIGNRLDGWAEPRSERRRDHRARADRARRSRSLLGVDEATVRTVLRELGPGQVRRGAAARRQGVPARRQVRGDADPAGVRARRRQPAHLDRAGAR